MGAHHGNRMARAPRQGDAAASPRRTSALEHPPNLQRELGRDSARVESFAVKLDPRAREGDPPASAPALERASGLAADGAARGLRVRIGSRGLGPDGGGEHAHKEKSSRVAHGFAHVATTRFSPRTVTSAERRVASTFAKSGGPDPERGVTRCHRHLARTDKSHGCNRTDTTYVLDRRKTRGTSCTFRRSEERCASC